MELRNSCLQREEEQAEEAWGLMIKYVDFLNEWHIEEAVDLAAVEEFWAEQIREYFRNQPFILTADTSKTIWCKFR